MRVRDASTQEAAGQHFLRSSQLAAALVAEADLAPGELVVEVGGGTGMLTQALVEAGAKVAVVERDPALVAHLRSRFGPPDAVEVTEGDAARYAWPASAFSVVSNLPFARSGAILGNLLRDPGTPLRRADVIVQWELAAKQAAVWPATLRSTYWGAWYDLSITRRLAPHAFSPPPSVTAAVLRIERRSTPRVAAARHEAYWRFLTTAFASGEPLRRGLGRYLSALEVKRLAPVLGFAPGARPRDLDAAQWSQLFEYAEKSPRGNGRPQRPPRRARSRPADRA